MVAALQPLVGPAPPPAVDSQTFFRVVNPRPEARHLVAPAYMQRSRTSIAVIQCGAAVGGGGGNMLNLFGTEADVIHVDLLALAGLDVLHSTFNWEQVVANAIVVPGAAADARLRSRAFQNEEADGCESPFLLAVHDLVRHMDALNAYSDADSGISPLDILAVAPALCSDDLDRLIEYGILETSLGDFGDEYFVRRASMDVKILGEVVSTKDL